MRDKVKVFVTRPQWEAVKALAVKDRRSATGQLEVLLSEALAARRAADADKS